MFSFVWHILSHLSCGWLTFSLQSLPSYYTDLCSGEIWSARISVWVCRTIYLQDLRTVTVEKHLTSDLLECKRDLMGVTDIKSHLIALSESVWGRIYYTLTLPGRRSSQSKQGRVIFLNHVCLCRSLSPGFCPGSRQRTAVLRGSSLLQESVPPVIIILF